MPANLTPALGAQLAHARSIIESHLGDGLVAIHLFGSTLHGGLKPSSDIDLLVFVDDSPSADTRNALMVDLLAASAPPGFDDAVRPLEVTVLARSRITPWRHPARREMQFGEWLRADIEAGRFEEPLIDHDVAILLSKALLHGVSLVGPQPRDVFDPIPTPDLMQALLATLAQWNVQEDWAGEERNIVLALARMWFTASTGDIASKDVAAAWLAERLPEEHREVVRNAAAAYLGETDDDDLARDPAAVAAFIQYARAAIIGIVAGAGS
jgi:streptomycin 3"-adenylyltransferase